MDRGAPRAPFVASELREVLVPGTVPRFEVPGWSDQFGVLAGITGRGTEAGRGFDLGLWSEAPIAEVMSRWRRLRQELPGFTAMVLGHQVHGTKVMSLDSGTGWIHIEGVDGWITSTPGILLTVTVADCIPVYLVAPGKGVGLLHSGWRGTAAGILRRGVEQLAEAIGVAPADILMHCGVGICGRCYEVGSEVMDGCRVPALGAGPWHLDLRELLAEQARLLGLGEVSTSPWCTAHDRGSFYSHRGSRGADGRMVAYIGMAKR